MAPIQHLFFHGKRVTFRFARLHHWRKKPMFVFQNLTARVCYEQVSPVEKKLPHEAMEIPLLDLTRKYRSIENELKQRWDTIFLSTKLFNGSNLAAFEKEFAAYCGVKHAIGVASGTDAIHLSLEALGISGGDEVILPLTLPPL